eukprot:Skav212813  [mRNA]  locus=scaffold1633:283008:285012:- [translate_table: standard]
MQHTRLEGLSTFLGKFPQAINFFPYQVSRSSYMSLAAKQLHLGSVTVAVLSGFLGACTVLLVQTPMKVLP